MPARIDTPGPALPTVTSVIYAASVGLIVLTGFMLRLYHDGLSSLRGDEAFSVVFSAQSVEVILRDLRAGEPHTPLYYVTLHSWMRLAGDSDLAVRFPTVAVGALAVPFAWLLGRELLGARLGLVFSALIAASPYLVWYSQEARPYVLLPTFALASVWFALRLLSVEGDAQSYDHRVQSAVPSVGLRYWLGYAVSTTLLLYAHYPALYVVLALNLPMAWRLVARVARRAWVNTTDTRPITGVLPPSDRRWWTAQLAAASLIAPWDIWARDMLLGHQVGWMAPTSPFDWLGHLVTTYVTGVALRWPWPLVAGGLAVVAGAVGVAQLARRRNISSWLIVSATLIPMPLAYLSSLGRPLFLERHFAFEAPFSLLACLVGVAAAARWRPAVGWMLGASLAIALAGGLWGAYFDESFVKAANWRGVAAIVRAKWTTGDAAISNSPDPAFRHYLSRALPAGATIVTLPDSGPPDRARTEAALTDLASPARTIWLAPVRDPSWDADGMVERWLDTYTFSLFDDRSTGQQVRRFGTAAAMLSLWPRSSPVVFDGRIRLLGADLSDSASAGSPEPRAFRPGSEVWLTLYFRPTQRLPLDYRVFNHLVAPDGRVYGQHDGMPLDGRHTTLAWAPGGLLMDRHRFSIEADAPAGRYEIRVGFYDPATGARLSVSDAQGRPIGDAATIDGVSVTQ